MVFASIFSKKYRVGAHGARETPVPIPNTEVKPRSGYNTWVIKPWENSTVPNYKHKNHPNRVVFVYVFLSLIFSGLLCRSTLTSTPLLTS
jgi:hypothetical protein